MVTLYTSPPPKKPLGVAIRSRGRRRLGWSKGTPSSSTWSESNQALSVPGASVPKCRGFARSLRETPLQRFHSINIGSRSRGALFCQICPLMSAAGAAYSLSMATPKTQSEHDAILKTLQLYIDGCKQGNSEPMRPARVNDFETLRKVV